MATYSTCSNRCYSRQYAVDQEIDGSQTGLASDRQRLNPLTNRLGFTLIELMICIALLGIIIGLSAPSLLDYRRSLDFKTTARGMTSMLRKARSAAVTLNVPQMVTFAPANGTYSWQVYDPASAAWLTAKETHTVPNTVTIRSLVTGTSTNIVYVQFNNNGTVKLKSPAGVPCDNNVSINSGATQMYVITISTTGRVSILKK